MISIINEDTQDDPIEELHEEPMIEHIGKDSPHVTITENIEYLRCSQVCCNANIFPKIPHEESITEIDTYEEIYDVYDETPLCSSLRDEVFVHVYVTSECISLVFLIYCNHMFISRCT